MIYYPDDSNMQNGELPVVSHIQSEIDAICGNDIDTEFLHEEISRAIDYFLKNESGAQYVKDTDITALAAKVFSSIGEQGTARRLMLFGTGMVKPAEWIVSGDKDVWVVNLKEITMQADASLELIFFRGIQIVLDSIADVWDECSGDGVLGLRHVCLAASSLLGAPRNSKAVAVLSEEIIDTTMAKLHQLKKVRGWRDVPFVLNLDF